MKKDTLIIIPAFNEEGGIERVLDDIFKNYSEADILVVNDGSIDRTGHVLKGKNIFLLEHISNLGIGASFQSGCQFALERGYDYIVRMDADGQHDARFVKDIVAPVKKNEVDVTIGSRFLGKTGFTSSIIRLLGISIISWILKVITKKKVTDPTSGFCAMNKKAFAFFSGNCVDDYPEPEILMYHKEFRITEVPIIIAKRCAGESSISPLKSFYYMFKVIISLFVKALERRKNECC